MTWATLAIAALLGAHAPFDAEIDSALAETAAIYPVPRALVVAVIAVESGFRPRAVSRAGAKGLMQLMPYTAKRVGIAEGEIFEPRRNILGGVRLLAVLLRHYDGDVISTLVAYNARPRRIFSPIPRNGETPRYVWKVLARTKSLQRTSAPMFRETRSPPAIAGAHPGVAVVTRRDGSQRDLKPTARGGGASRLGWSAPVRALKERAAGRGRAELRSEASGVEDLRGGGSPRRRRSLRTACAAG